MGFQIQTPTEAARSMVRATWPSTLKVILPGGLDAALLEEWRRHRPDGILVLRHYFGDESLDPTKVDRLLAAAEPLRHLGPICEIPINEAHQNGAELGPFAAYTVEAVEALAAHGFRAVVGNFSEGNPADLNDWVRFHPALRAARRHGGYLGLHEYWTPASFRDGWHNLRYRRVFTPLPDDCRVPILITECGTDGGVNAPDGNRPRSGWRAYGPPDLYQAQLHYYHDELCRDDYVHGATVFLCGGYAEWSSFDVTDEEALRSAFTEQIDAPARWQPGTETAPRPVPTPVPIPDAPSDKLAIGLQYRQGSDVPEKNEAELAGLCARLGASIISPKAMDGTSFMAEFDADPLLRIGSLEDVRRQRDAYAALGGAYHPWVVPRGYDYKAEAAAHAAVARETGVLLVDYEFLYEGFWGRRADGTSLFRDTPTAAARGLDYFRLLRDAAPDAYLILQPDHRQIQAQAYDLGAIAAHVDAAAPQAYWPWFAQDWRTTVAEIQRIDWRGLHLTLTVYSSDATHPADPTGTADALEFLRASMGAGPLPAYVFQRVGLTDALTRAIASRGGAPAPPMERDATAKQDELTRQAVLARWENGYWAPLWEATQTLPSLPGLTEEDHTDNRLVFEAMLRTKARRGA